MSQIKLQELKNYLANKSETELKQEIIELFKLFPTIKEYYSLKVKLDGEDEVLEKYKKKVKDEFFPDKGFGKLRLSDAKKAISDFKKISKSPKNIADLMVSYVEYGVEFTNEYGDINEAFYYSIEKMYLDAMDYISNNGLGDYFEKRLSKIKDNSTDIGWGFEDNMVDIYYQYFEE